MGASTPPTTRPFRLAVRSGGSNSTLRFPHEPADLESNPKNVQAIALDYLIHNGIQSKPTGSFAFRSFGRQGTEIRIDNDGVESSFESVQRYPRMLCPFLRLICWLIDLGAVRHWADPDFVPIGVEAFCWCPSSLGSSFSLVMNVSQKLRNKGLLLVRVKLASNRRQWWEWKLCWNPLQVKRSCSPHNLAHCKTEILVKFHGRLGATRWTSYHFTGNIFDNGILFDISGWDHAGAQNVIA